MLATLSYMNQNIRKQIELPYYEIENITQEIYEKCKQTDDFDFATFEQQYTYFKPYLDYILLQKQGKLDSFLMDENNSIYADNHTLYYFSKNCTRFHAVNGLSPYLCADDKSIMLNQRNVYYDSILLSDATSLSYKEAKMHDLLLHFYLHQVLSRNKEIALYYKEWKQHKLNPQYEDYFFDHEQTFLSMYLSTIRCYDAGDLLFCMGLKEIETDFQKKWLEKYDVEFSSAFPLNEKQIETAKQFMKSFS